MSEMKSQKREASLIKNNTMLQSVSKYEGFLPKQETSHHVGMIEKDDFTQQITRVYSPTLIVIVDFHRFHYIVIKKRIKISRNPASEVTILFASFNAAYDGNLSELAS